MTPLQSPFEPYCGPADIPKPKETETGTETEQPKRARHRRTLSNHRVGLEAPLITQKIEEMNSSRNVLAGSAKDENERDVSLASRILVAISVVALLAVLAYSFQPLHLREQLIARPAALANREPQQNMYSKPLAPEKWLATRERGAMEVGKTKAHYALRPLPRDPKPKFRKDAKIFSNQQVPKVVKARGTKFMMCTLPKNGCSQWKRLILKVMGAGRSVYLDSKNSDSTIHNPKRYRPLNTYTQPNIDAMLRDDWMPRIAIVRNPYARILSAYQNKIVTDSKRWRYHKHLGLRSAEPTFEEFVKALQRWQRNHAAGLRVQSGLDHHFALQSSMCGFSMDTSTEMSYDYVLKVEETNTWYTALIQKLNLTQHVESGWPGKRCFFSAPDAECDGQRMDDTGSFSSLSWDHHGTGAAASLAEMYSPETARIVSDLYAVDIAAFGYQRQEVERHRTPVQSVAK